MLLSLTQSTEAGRRSDYNAPAPLEARQREDAVDKLKIEKSTGGIAPFGGGYPVRIDGTVVGANGVSGGSVEQDMACAEAALADLAQL